MVKEDHKSEHFFVQSTFEIKKKQNQKCILLVMMHFHLRTFVLCSSLHPLPHPLPIISVPHMWYDNNCFGSS